MAWPGYENYVPPLARATKANTGTRRKSQSVVPMLVQQCYWEGVPAPETEVQFHPTRKWRADLLWRTPRKLIVEVEGGVFIQGRHSRGAGMEQDILKYAEALLLGFPVLRVTPRHVKSGQAVAWVKGYFLEGMQR